LARSWPNGSWQHPDNGGISIIRYDLDEDLDLPDHPEICGLAQDFLEQFLIKAVQLVD